MYTGIYKLADEIVEIRSIYSEVHQMCRDYAWVGSESEREKAIVVETTIEEIHREQTMSDEEMKYEGLEAIQYPESYLETLAIYRKICGEMVYRDVLLMHGSVIAVDGQGYLFTAASGTGKSTHVRLWRKLFGERAVMVNDDKPLVRVKKSKESKEGIEIIVYGTPWDGKHHLSNNISVPLKGICILERGEKNEIHRITPEDAIAMLIQQSHRPTNIQAAMTALDLLGEIAENVALYELHCNMEDEAAKVSYEGMR